MPRDLEAVCLKALEKEPARRHSDCLALSEELARWERGEPVRSRPIGWSSRLVRWSRRNPLPAGLTAAVLLSLVLGAGVSLNFALESSRRAEAFRLKKEEADGQRQRAEEGETKAKQETDRAEGLRKRAETGETLAKQEAGRAETQRQRAVANATLARQETARADTQRQRTEEETERALRTAYAAQLMRVDALWEKEPDRALGLLYNCNLCPINRRELAWHCYVRACPRERSLLSGHASSVNSVVFSRDGKTLVSASTDQTIRVWEASTGQLKTTLRGHAGAVLSLALSADGKTLVSGSHDQTIRLWDLDSGELRTTLKGHTAPVWSVALSRDGKTLASASGDKTIRLWDLGSGELKAALNGHTGIVWSVVFSSDDRTLASASGDKTIRLWDAGKGAHKATLQSPAASWTLAWSRTTRPWPSAARTGSSACGTLAPLSSRPPFRGIPGPSRR